MLVVVEVSLDPVVGHKQVGPAIVIVVAGKSRKVDTVRVVDLGGLGDVGERPVAVVVVEIIGAAPVDGRPATAQHAPTDVAVALAGGKKITVPAHVEVQPSVVVVVEEGRSGVKSGPEFRGAHARLVRHVGEGAVTVIVIKDVFSVLCDVQVGESIVVIVSPDAAQAVSGAGDARLLRDVGERPITIVVEEGVAGGESAIVQIASADDIEVHVAVAIIVRRTNSGTGLLQDGGGAVAALEMDKVNSGRLGNVRELHHRGRRRGAWTRVGGRLLPEERHQTSRSQGGCEPPRKPGPRLRVGLWHLSASAILQPELTFSSRWWEVY